MKRLIFLATLVAAMFTAHGQAQAAGPWLCSPQIYLGWCTNIPSAPLTTTINPSQTGATQSRQKFGTDSSMEIDMTASTPNGVALWTAYNSLPLYQVRWPNDRTDQQHCWTGPPYTGSCNATNPNGFYLPDAVCNATYDPNSGASTGFGLFLAQVALLGAEVGLSANYGCDYAGDGPGDPNEAAAIAAMCNTVTGNKCLYDTVGTEIYNCLHGGHLCDDLHGTCGMNARGQCNTQGSLTGDPTTYGTNFPTFQTAITAAAPVTHTCVLGAPWKANNLWDGPVKTALGGTTPGCQEIECYPMSRNNQVTDTYALNSAVSWCDNATLTTGPTAPSMVGIALANYPGVTIYIDQWGLYSSSPPPQSQSIVAALYFGMQMMEFQLDPNIVRAAYHSALAINCTNNNFQTGQYGWNNGPNITPYGTASAFSNATGSCPSFTAVYGQAMANAYAMQVTLAGVHTGETMLGISTTGPGNSDVQTYAATNGSGYVAVLFNKSISNTYSTNLAITGKVSGTGGTTLLYGKAQYDAAGPPICNLISNPHQCWAANPPVSGSFGAWSGSIPITLPPYSETEVTIN